MYPAREGQGSYEHGTAQRQTGRETARGRGAPWPREAGLVVVAVEVDPRHPEGADHRHQDYERELRAMRDRTRELEDQVSTMWRQLMPPGSGVRPMARLAPADRVPRRRGERPRLGSVSRITPEPE